MHWSPFAWKNPAVAIVVAIALVCGCSSHPQDGVDPPSSPADQDSLPSTILTAPDAVEAGPDRTASPGDEVVLTALPYFAGHEWAGNSEGQGAQMPLEYRWSQSAGIAVELSDPTAQSVSFITPRIESPSATLSFEVVLIVDGALELHDTVNVVVSLQEPDDGPIGGASVGDDPQPPVADAGDDVFADAGTMVTLDGSASFDPGGQPLTFLWEQVSGPSIQFEDNTVPVARFEAPDLDGDYHLTFTLTVENGSSAGQDLVMVHVMDPAGADDPDDPPADDEVDTVRTPITADAGPDLDDVACEVVVTLDGSGSSSGEGINYLWVQTAGPSVELQDLDKPVATFVTPSGHTEDVSLTFELVLTREDEVDSDEVVVDVPACSSDDDEDEGEQQGPAPPPPPPPPPPGCSDDQECDDGVFCNGAETCEDGSCQTGQDPCPGSFCSEDQQQCVGCLDDGDCDDGVFCNGAEACEDGSCVAGDEPCTDRQCDETVAACVECIDDIHCDDRLFCNGEEVCQGGVCLSGDNPCPDSLCSESGDECVECLGDGDCDDGLFCNGVETCQAGVCQSGSNPCPGAICVEADDVCVGCLHDSDCNDGLFCNGQETCDEGTCQPGADPCPDSLCSEPGDECVECLYDGDCDDGLFCDGSESCEDGTCSSGTDPCPGELCRELDDQCVECLGDGDCDDGLFCNGTEKCTGGVCTVGVDPCPDSLCDEDGDSCVGCLGDGDCDDGLFCNGQETCEEGMCEVGKGPCAGGYCRESDDQCVECLGDSHCSDGLFCNGQESCDDGTCQTGADPCPDSLCSELGDECVECLGGGDCDDGLFCTGSEACLDGVCQAGESPCSSDEICDEDADTCQETAGEVYYVDDNGAEQPGYDPGSPAGSHNNPFATIQAGVDVAQGGDTVFVMAGTYHESITARRNGTADAPITIQSASGDPAVLDGQHSLNDAFASDSKTYQVISGFEIKNYNRYGAYILNDADHCTIRYCKIHSVSTCVFLRGGDYALVEWCELFDSSGGTRVSWRDSTGNRSNYATVRYNLSYGHGAAFAEAGDGISVSGGSYATVHHNICWLNLDDGIDISGSSGRYPEQAVVYHNVCFKNGFEDFDTVHTGDGDGNGFKSSTNVGGGHVLHHNVSFLNKRSGFDYDDVSPDWGPDSFYNNVAWRNGNHDQVAQKAGFILRGKATGGREAPLRNNVAWGNNPPDRANPSVRFDLYEANRGIDVDNADHNVWGRTVTQIPGAVDATDVELGEGLSTDPDPGLFNNPDATINVAFTGTGDLETDIQAKWQMIRDQIRSNFTPVSLEYLIDRGTVIPGITDGYEGAAPEVGAFETAP